MSSSHAREYPGFLPLILLEDLLGDNVQPIFASTRIRTGMHNLYYGNCTKLGCLDMEIALTNLMEFILGVLY